MKDLTGREIKLSDKSRVKVEKVLGGGGQAIAYSAKHLGTGERGVLKQFQTTTAEELDATRKRVAFLVAARLHERSLLFRCAPRAWFADPKDGVCHFAFVAPGNSVDTLIENGWSASLLDLLQCALALVRAITRLHKDGWTHGDLQGGNLFIEETGSVLKVWLIDYDNFGHPKQPAPQPCLGQMFYLAPEIRVAHARGVSLPVDQAAERFSLGVMLHQLLLLRHPGHRTVENPALFKEQMTSGVWSDDPMRAGSSEIPGGYPAEVLNATLQGLMRRALAVHPEDRPAVTEWEVALAEAVESVFIHDECGGPVVIDRTKTTCPMCGRPYPGLGILMPDGAFRQITGGGLRLGRENLGSHLTLSGHHANIERIGPEFRLTSYGLNGTCRWTPTGWLRLPDRVPVLIKAGDRLRFADAVEALVA